MRTIQRYYTIASVLLALILLTVLWRDIQHRGLLQKLDIGKSAELRTTNDTPFWAAQSNRISTPTCHIVNYYELCNSSRTRNVTLYVTSNNIYAGRLGNQMFIYASLLGISRAQGRQMFIQPGTSLGQTFKISYVNVTESIHEWLVVNQDNLFDDKLMDLPVQNVKIKGYLQSFFYFIAVTDEVRQEFIFHDSIANSAATILRDVYAKYNSSMIVGVHVRRGDFLTEKHKKIGYGVAEKSYFIKAFSLMKSKFPGRDIVFLILSDDLKWCSENLLGNDVSITPPASAAVHLAVLSSCDHVIISGGTFGWWSGWLANGYVIYYTGHLKAGTILGNFVSKYHYYPRKWIGLGN